MSEAPLKSCLYECSVMHHRIEPKEHRFRYGIFLFSLDLDELDEVERRVTGFRHNGRSVYEFRDRDHLTVPEIAEGASVKEHVIHWVAKQGLELPPDVKITLVTLPRVLGYIFNPVSFYYCYDATGKALCTVVQVGNTFGEMKPYLLREEMPGGGFRLITPKHFYVSPFSELDLSFDFKVKPLSDVLDIHIDDRAADRRVLLSALTGRRVPLTSARLAWLTVKYPLITLKVIFLIHWHALLLWLKRLPWQRKADNPHLQQNVFHPHESIARIAPE